MPPLGLLHMRAWASLFNRLLRPSGVVCIREVHFHSQVSQTECSVGAGYPGMKAWTRSLQPCSTVGFFEQFTGTELSILDALSFNPHSLLERLGLFPFYSLGNSLQG